MNRPQCRAPEKASAFSQKVPSPNLQQSFTEALELHQAGRLPDAQRLYRQILAFDARNADALHLLGLIAHQLGRSDVAVNLIGKAIRINGTAATYLSNLGIALTALGKLDDAVNACITAIRAKPDYAEAHYNLGISLKALGRLDDAVNAYKSAIRCKPDFAEAHSNLGIALAAMGRREDAVNAYCAAIRTMPDYAEAYSNLGNTLKDQGRLDDAVNAYNAGICVKPNLAEAHSNRGIALTALGRLNDAVNACNSAIRVKPDYAEAHANLGNALKTLGKLDDAVNAYNEAIRAKPDLAEAHSNLGIALNDLGKLDDAVNAYNTALRFKPDYAEAHSNLGNTLKDQGRLDDAVKACNAAIRFKPDLAEAHANLGVALKDLGRLDEAVNACNTAIRFKPDYAEAHSNLLMCLHYHPQATEAVILEKALDFASRVEKVRTSSCTPADPDRRLRIGYVSGDFKRHPVGYFLSRVLTNHDPNAVEIFCYSNTHRADDLTALLKGAADHWRSLVGLSDQTAAALITSDRIDILVDLSGHTALNRLTMFALKPAPVQIAWLGYFGTTGLAAMDYILADRFVVPEPSSPFFTESIWRLPDSYLCFSPPDLDCPIFSPPVTKGEPLTFGNFNNHAKTSLAAVSLWSRILSRAPGSRLLLKTMALADSRARQDLLDQFVSNGIEAERILLEGASPRAELLSSYNRVDIALDPTPYGGGITTAEALWMGVPVVTLHGPTWVGRVSESILSTVGLPHLVAATPDDYVGIAVGLANDKTRLEALRSGLRPQLEASPFCDGSRFTRGLEQAYRSMWKQWCADQITKRSPNPRANPDEPFE